MTVDEIPEQTGEGALCDTESIEAAAIVAYRVKPVPAMGRKEAASGRGRLFPNEGWEVTGGP